MLDKPKKLKKKTKFLKPVMKERTLLSTLKKLRYLRKYYEQYYAIKLENLDEMENFLQRHKLSKLTQEEIENLNIPIISR